MERALSIGFFSVLGVVCFLTLSVTLWHQPLFAFKTEDVAWLQAWLYMTVLDYYGACIPFCAVILANEASMTSGVLWSLACIFLGSPFCCLWMVLRLMSDRGQGRFPL